MNDTLEHHPRRNGTVPEAPETIEAQLRWLKEGKRKAVLIPPGTTLPDLPAGSVEVFLTSDGLFVFRPWEVTRAEICDAISAGTIGTLLGYGVPSKPAHAKECIVIRGPKGEEKQAVVVDDATRLDARRAAEAMKDPGDTVGSEPPEATLAARLNILQRRELKLRPFNAAQHTAAIEAQHRACDTSFPPVGVTHVVERDGKVVGWAGVNSLPFYRLSITAGDVTAQDCLGVLAVIENQYRMAGVNVVATLFDVDCASYPYKERCGYIEMPDARLALKTL